MPRLFFLFALALAGTAAAKDPPAGRPAFDPSLLTRPADGGVMCFRPAELVAQAGAPDEAVTGVMTQLAKACAAFVDGELKADDLPAAADIEQAVFGLTLSLKLGGGEGKSEMGMQGTNFGYVRTKGKFDWNALIKKTFPKAEAKTHAGREYLTAGIKFGTLEIALHFFAADERTLVFDVSGEKMEAALAAWGERKAPDMPAGWDDVKGCSVAFVMPMGDRKWMTSAGRLDENGKQVKKFVNSLHSACVGVTLGDTTTAMGVFTATSPKAATASEDILTKAWGGYKELLGEAFADKVSVKTTRDGKTVRVEGVAKVNAIKEYLKANTKEDTEDK